MKLTNITLIFLFLTSCAGKTTNKTAKEINSVEKIQSEQEIYSNDELILGERIDGPANLRSSANGKILFTLKDNVLVQTTPIKDKWHQVGLFIELTEQENKVGQIMPNTNLISNGNIIGKTMDTVEIWMERDGIGFIGAYTFIDNIKPFTKPEVVISKEIENKNLTKSSLSKFIENFELKEYKNGSLPSLNQVMLYENLITDLSPRDRITLLFDSTGVLNGIVHSREIIAKNYKQYNLVRGHTLTITTDMETEKIQDLIENRIDFYNSVD